MPRKRVCAEDRYVTGRLFLSMNDGSGAVYYPSGRLALCTSLCAHGTYVWAFDDTDSGQLLASLSPLGGGSCFKPGHTLPFLTTTVDGGSLFGDEGKLIKLERLAD